jgi:DNA-directed RNA polymerase beta' subunit
MPKGVLKEIQFGIMSAMDIKAMSVVSISNPKLHGLNSVYDERLGANITKKLCVTCGLNSHQCPGHFGHIVLNTPIFHPLCDKIILRMLRITCFSCYRLVKTQEQFDFDEDDEIQFIHYTREMEKIQICSHCGLVQPKWSASADGFTSVFMQFEPDTALELFPNDVLYMFNQLKDEDLVLIGIDVKHMHPRNLIMEVLPVLPTISRPIVVVDGNLCDDDLTLAYVEIIKVNNLIKSDPNPTKYQKYLKTLTFRVSTFLNNSNGRSKHSTNGRAIKGIKERLAGKNGLIRENIMGKRVEQSARTVIGAEPMLCMDQLGVPPEIASNLTVDECVNQYNMNWISGIVNRGEANFLKRTKETGEVVEKDLRYSRVKRGTQLLQGDIIVRKGREIPYAANMKLQRGDIVRRGVERVPVQLDAVRPVTLHIGDIVSRHLRDGDIVLLNRQPTLHRGSMIAQKIKILPGKTFRFSLAITRSFNADFDNTVGNRWHLTRLVETPRKEKCVILP